MQKNGLNEFNGIINEMMQKSHLTNRQFEIILNHKKIIKTKINITSGAYYRQIKQIRMKLNKLNYTLIILYYFGIINEEQANNITKLAKQLSVIKYSNNIIGDNDKIIYVINQFIQKLNLI